jgi:hypothetical protein
MAKQYVVTEEEFMSLIEQLELHKLRSNNVCDPTRDLTPQEREKLKYVTDSLHRGFHFVAVQWVQQMGFRGIR